MINRVLKYKSKIIFIFVKNHLKPHHRQFIDSFIIYSIIHIKIKK